MPLTQLDPIAALLVIDLQKGITSMPLLHPAAEIVARSAALAEAFRRRNLPVVLINVDAAAPGRTDMPPRIHTFPPDFAELDPGLNPQPSDHRITKHRVGAFHGTSLDKLLAEHGVTQVFLMGIATGSGVEATARSAHDLGYHVVLVTDAVTDRSLEAHHYCLTHLFPKLAETTTTEEALAFLKP
jgi:nicotinamidase-related amidase